LSHRLRPRREETKDDVAICLPGAKNGRSTTSTWDLRGGRHLDRGRATEGADDADGDDEDIGDTLSANINSALDLSALCAA
jgi:hypothetical protein